jgi:hypothetical protein
MPSDEPNAETIAAMKETERKSFNTVEEMMADLNSDESEAMKRLKRITKAEEWERDKDGYINHAAEEAHIAATLWSLNQISREEYFAQDILTRIDQARMAMTHANVDPLVWRDGGIGISVMDVIHDAIVEIKRLRANPHE